MADDALGSIERKSNVILSGSEGSLVLRARRAGGTLAWRGVIQIAIPVDAFSRTDAVARGTRDPSLPLRMTCAASGGMIPGEDVVKGHRGGRNEPEVDE